jgi:hypothetical protein
MVIRQYFQFTVNRRESERSGIAGHDGSDQSDPQELHGTRPAASSPPLKLKAENQCQSSVCLASSGVGLWS